MNGGIYLIQDDGQLVEMSEQAYDSEDLLQELLAKYPKLLAGDQIDDAAPRKWLLITREALLPSEENGGGRFSIDHLLIDQDAILTLVEVKRSNDTRIRREVVGQMLDYAANAVIYLTVEELRATFEANCKAHCLDPNQEFGTLFGTDVDQKQFWQTVKTNLQAGKIRLVFVADEIPAELQRVVEFLNEQMDPAEILAIEIKQYVGQGLKTLVPRVLGQTAEAQKKKSSPTPPVWDEISFFRELKVRRSDDESEIARKILEWSKQNLPRFTWGRGWQSGSFFPVLDHKGLSHWPFGIWTYGSIEIQFQRMKTMPPFNDVSKRMELLNRLNKIPGVYIPTDAITRRPSVPLSALKNETALDQFFETLDWIVQEIKAS
jgi:hypothetical protein